MPGLPIGLQLSRTAHVLGQAFERTMAEAGGSAATWQVLVLIRSRRWGRQSEMAAELGITGPTLTHHLTALERRGLVRRWREDANRRAQRVELTDDGIAMFEQLRGAATRFDALLREQLSDAEAAQLADLLDRLRAGVEREP